LVPAQRTLAGGALLALVAAVTIASIAPPAPRPADSPADEFSAARAMAHLAVIAKEPHPPGSRAHAAVRAYLIQELERLGLEPRVQAAQAAARMAGTVWSLRAVNVLGRLRGTRGGRALILAAHYDTVPQSPGASDDGAAVAVLLETARALRAGPPMANDVLVLFTDGEEMAMRGAQAAVEDPELLKGAALVMNFEARGNGGPSVMFETSASSGTLLREVAAAAPYPTLSSPVTALAQALPNGTDSLVFKRSGFAVLGFAFANGIEHYHRTTDSVDRIDRGSVQHHGSYALALARRFGERDLADLRAPEVVYFDLFGRAAVVYPISAARAFAALTLALLFFVVARGIHARRLTGRGIAKGAGLQLVAAFAASLAVTATQVLLGRVVDGWMLLARSRIFAWHALFLGAAVIVTLFARSLRRNGPWDLAAGAMLPWGALLATAAIVAPSITAPLTWPLLFSLLGFVVWQRGPTFAIYLGLVPAVVTFANLVYAVFVAAGALAPFAPVLLFSLLAGLLIPALADATPNARSFLAWCSLGGSVAAAAVGVLGARYGEDEPRVDSLVYVLDHDSGDARWITYDDALDPWVTARVPRGASNGPLPGFTRSDKPLKSAPAPHLALPPPEIEVRSDTTRGGTRTLALRLRSPGHPRCVRLWDAGGARIWWAPEMDGAPVRDFFRISPPMDEVALRAMTGDSTSRVWHAVHCALDQDALELTLNAAPGAPLKLRVVEEHEGLPAIRGAPVPPRPRGLAPAMESDVTLVGRTFEL
jgi:hypothetical protein